MILYTLFFNITRDPNDPATPKLCFDSQEIAERPHFEGRTPHLRIAALRFDILNTMVASMNDNMHRVTKRNSSY